MKWLKRCLARSDQCGRLSQHFYSVTDPARRSGAHLPGGPKPSARRDPGFSARTTRAGVFPGPTVCLQAPQFGEAERASPLLLLRQRRKRRPGDANAHVTHWHRTVAELGLEPRPSTRELGTQLLSQSSSCSPPPPCVPRGARQSPDSQAPRNHRL